MSAETWHIDDRTARFNLSHFGAAIDLDQPAAGLQDVTLNGVPLADFSPLRVELTPASSSVPVPPCDFYVRGHDLVVDYAERPGPAMRAQLDWRAGFGEDEPGVAGLELLVSVQTGLLDSCPRIAISSEMPAAEVYKLVDAEQGRFAKVAPQPDWSAGIELSRSPHCFVFRNGVGRYSYVEMIAPGDADRSDWHGWYRGGDFHVRLAHRLFSDELEKGVILRARLRGLFVDPRDDLAAAARHYRAFLDAALPLTT